MVARRERSAVEEAASAAGRRRGRDRRGFRRTLRAGRHLVVALVLCASVAVAHATPPSVVFILLDTTRADRFGAWGHPGGITPALDGLASRGVRFVRHYANSHATRPSMPQLLS